MPGQDIVVIGASAGGDFFGGSQAVSHGVDIGDLAGDRSGHAFKFARNTLMSA